MTSPRVFSDASTILGKVTVSDPIVDEEREAQRQIDALSINDSNITTMQSTPKRQDFSSERGTKRDVRLGEYTLGQTLGEGEFGKVKMGWKKGGVQVAVKLIRREKLDNEQRMKKVYREIAILQQINHPNIVRLHEMVETERVIGIILEYASGGELFDYILHHRYLRDNSACRLFAQLISGVGYLHRRGIIHRDLKLENLMLDRNKNLIITDFGFANTFDPNDDLGDKIESRLHDRNFVKKYRLDEVQENGLRRGDLMATSCGSPCYAAPELVVSDSIYTGRKVDIWSCGVILYAMLAGYLPFDDDPANPEGDNINLLYKYIVNTPLVFPEYVTPHARDILRRILVPDPRKRADLFEVASHSWLSDYTHLFEHITSGTANDAKISSTGADGQYGTPESKLNRSASVREPVKPLQQGPPIRDLLSKPQEPYTSQPKTDRDAKRRTVQVEYVAPSSQNTRGGEKPTVDSATKTQESPSVEPSTRSTNQQSTPLASYAPPKQSMQQPTRPGREVPRSTSDSNAFTNNMPVTRPSTQGSSRLPSRGSYGQPAAATVATTNAQGSFAQPKTTHVPISPFDNMGGRLSMLYDTTGSPSTVASSYQPQSVATEPQQRGHKRSNTLTNLSDKIFGRSNSTRKSTDQRQKPDRSYPPTSMRPMPTETGPRKSTDSKRSFGFSRKSSDLSTKEKRSSRRFSFIPRWGSNTQSSSPPSESTADEPTTPNVVQSNPNLYVTHTTPYVAPTDSSQQDGTARDSAERRRVGADRTVHSTPNFYPSEYYPNHISNHPGYTPYVAGATNLKPANRQFDQQYEEKEAGHAGSSGAARKVMDFFRRRGKGKDY